MGLIKITKSELSKLYVGRKLSMKMIAQMKGCNPTTICRKLKNYQIPARNPWEHKYIDVEISEIDSLYWEKKRSINQIAKKLGLSYSKIRTEMLNNDIKRRKSIDVSINRPILTYSKNLCYILGVLLGDGYVSINASNYVIALESIDFEFIEVFAHALRKIKLQVSGSYSRKRNERHNTIFKIEARSKIFLEWYKSLAFEDIKKIIGSVGGYVQFLKGIYESEGSYFLTREGRHTITIASTNKELMFFLKDTLNNYGFSPTFPKPQYLKSNKPYYKLYFNKQNEIPKFVLFVNPVIKNRPHKRVGE